jgi:hypothetical protein
MSHLLTRERAQLAVDLGLTIFNDLTDRKIISDNDLHIIVLDPAHKGEYSEAAILFERSIGDRSKWTYDYKEIARRKAEMTYEHKLPSQVIVEQRPYLLEGRDTKYWGSAYLDGIVVAISGSECYFDAMLSEIIASLCKGLCSDEMHKNIVPASGATMDCTPLPGGPRPLEIDLRGKTVEEVMEILQDNGFTVRSSDITDIYDSRETVLSKQEVHGSKVYAIWLKSEERHLLTVIPFHGEKVQVPADHNLHLFAPSDKNPEWAWGVANTGHYMK